ncbi:MAG: hypothetical protein QM758_18930 [Armatimonas sp.]
MNRSVTGRAVAIGLVCAGFLCAVTPYNDFKVAATYIAGTQFPIGALFVLFVLAFAVNTLLRRVAPRKVFSSGELLTVWTLILVASGLPSSGMMRYFLPEIVAHKAFANDTNNFDLKLMAGAPKWVQFQDKAAADAFFNGYRRGEEHIPWGAWAGPLFFWGILAMLFLLATFSVCSLLRRQWVENEKFSFPFVTLPVLIAEEPEPGRRVNALFRSPLLWLGFIICTVIHSINGLHKMYPQIPEILMRWDLNQFMTVRPWDQIGWFPAQIYIMVIGIAYLLPAEVCFSLWFFFLVFKAQVVLCVLNNWLMPGPQGYGDYHFTTLQAYGGGIALVVWTFWTGRKHFSDIAEKAFGGPRAASIDDSGELIGYRASLICLVLAYVGIAVWLTLAGVSGLLVGISLVTLTLGLIVISWAVCQAGLLFMAQPYLSVDLPSFLTGTAPFSPSQLYTMTRAEIMFIADPREMLAPSVLMGAKASESSSGRPRTLMAAMALTVFVAFGISLYAGLQLPYYNGGGNSLQNQWTYQWSPERPLNFLGGAASVPFKGDWTNGFHLLAGFAVFLGLLIARAQFNVGIHPIGLICSSVYAMKVLWLSIFLGWFFKSIISRYGGMKGYLHFLPLFLGVILGDTVNAVIWVILGNLTGVGYSIMPD